MELIASRDVVHASSLNSSPLTPSGAKAALEEQRRSRATIHRVRPMACVHDSCRARTQGLNGFGYSDLLDEGGILVHLGRASDDN
ncbi:MAG TPA: hypothetical protein VEX68_10670 [Bryobacteraceae bacterium]|nr:hypothetical protein [Bryobacteraceae bacterium]